MTLSTSKVTGKVTASLGTIWGPNCALLETGEGHPVFLARAVLRQAGLESVGDGDELECDVVSIDAQSSAALFARPPGPEHQQNEQDEANIKFYTTLRHRKYKEAVAQFSDPVSPDVNFHDPSTGATALHFAAAHSAELFIKRLEDRENLQYFVWDNQLRYPSELAWTFADNPELGLYLAEREAEEARKLEMRAWPKPPLSLIALKGWG